MPCFHPLDAFRTDAINPDTGRRGLTFNPLKAVNSALPLKLPCGQCRGCRHDKAAAWAIRCGHESKFHEASSFITLTYSDEHMPADGGVHKLEWQLFMKRLRERSSAPLRFFACGEYGEELGRPHYHALIFGEDFRADRTHWATRNGHCVYRSKLLEELWPFGQSELGSVTPASAGYVARYCLKKFTGKDAADHYTRPHPVTGVLHQVQPEFALMSRRPGIGSAWFDKFAGDAFPSDFVIVDGRKKQVPSFYLRKLEKAEAEPVEAPGRILRAASVLPSTRIKRVRKAKSAKPASKWNRSKERLAVREEVFRRKTERLIRPL